MTARPTPRGGRHPKDLVIPLNLVFAGDEPSSERNELLAKYPPPPGARKDHARESKKKKDDQAGKSRVLVRAVLSTFHQKNPLPPSSPRRTPLDRRFALEHQYINRPTSPQASAAGFIFLAGHFSCQDPSTSARQQIFHAEKATRHRAGLG